MRIPFFGPFCIFVSCLLSFVLPFSFLSVCPCFFPSFLSLFSVFLLLFLFVVPVCLSCLFHCVFSSFLSFSLSFVFPCFPFSLSSFRSFLPPNLPLARFSIILMSFLIHECLSSLLPSSSSIHADHDPPLSTPLHCTDPCPWRTPTSSHPSHPIPSPVSVCSPSGAHSGRPSRAPCRSAAARARRASADAPSARTVEGSGGSVELWGWRWWAAAGEEE